MPPPVAIFRFRRLRRDGSALRSMLPESHQSSASALGAGGPRFKSARPDHLLLCFQFTLADTVCIRGDEGLYWLHISSQPSLKWRHSDLNQGQRASHVSWSTIEFRNESSTSLAIAAVDKGERDLRCTRISRFDDFPKARREERSGAARAGQTVFTALVSINQSPAYRDLPGTVDHKSSNRADERTSTKLWDEELRQRENSQNAVGRGSHCPNESLRDHRA